MAMPSTPSLPTTLESTLETLLVPVPAAAMRALGAFGLPGREITAEALGRAAAYSEESFLRRRKTPRFAWVLYDDGTVVTPRYWALGSWRLSRRIWETEAVAHWDVVLALYLAGRMASEPGLKTELIETAAKEAVSRVLGPRSLDSLPDWHAINVELASHQHPLGPAATTAEQDRTAARLEKSGLTPFSLFFGTRVAPRLQPDRFPPGLRLPFPGERGATFEDILDARSGDNKSLRRDVTSYLLEWASIRDRLARDPMLQEYAELWGTGQTIAEERNEQFRNVFPSEKDPGRLLSLLWSGQQQQSFLRLMGTELVEDRPPPTVVNQFVLQLADSLRRNPEIGSHVMREVGPYTEGSELVGDPAREVRRFFALSNRATRWSADVLRATGEDDAALQVLSLEPVTDEHSAVLAERMLGAFRRGVEPKGMRDVLTAVQKALRVGGSLTTDEPMQDATPYVEGVAWAARALAKMLVVEGFDLVGEAGATLRQLQAVH
jgi:hypothetical protein